jgi:hypothetical protein
VTYVIDAGVVERALHGLYIAAEGTSLRREDHKKALEIAALLSEIARVPRTSLLVDAAAGKAYVGLLAAEILGFSRIHVIERDAARRAACEAARARLAAPIDLHVAAGDVADPSLWPEAPGIVVALHACGAASDLVIDAAIRAAARWLYLVPCCYAASVPFAAQAVAKADALGIPRQAEVRRRFVMSLVDAERTLRLEASGYEVTATSFVPPTVTPHNLLFRARRALEPTRMREAASRLAALSA